MASTIRSRQPFAAVLTAGVLALGVSGAAAAESEKKFYGDDPLWAMPRPVAVAGPSGRKLNEYYDFFENTLFSPGERKPQANRFLPSAAINTVDEVPDSAWYTNRHASRPMSIEELRRGPGNSAPPAEGRWRVIAAKNEGVTPGFRIRDAAGRQYLLKFDPPANPEMASAADVITSKFFYALGYNVPENYVVYFDRSRIAIEDGAILRDEKARKRPIRAADIDEMLAKAPRRPDGTYRALASRLISGKPIGPFRYFGTRGDDPNDLVPHEERRDLRALRTFCAWLGHDDSKALNTLDVLTEEDGTPFIKHYLIDFGASLGSASFMANSPRDGNVYLFDWKTSAIQFFTLGLYAPGWQRARYPKLPAAGRFEYEVFDPERWVPDYPNAAFRNENPADRLWAARKILAFTEDEIRAIVSTGQYSDPVAEAWVTRCLVERRKKILNAYLNGTASLDRFEVRNGRLEFQTVGSNPAPAAGIRVEWSVFDNATGRREPLAGEASFQLPRTDESAEFLAAELTGASGPPVSVYVRTRPDPKVVGVERRFASIRQKDQAP
jgi:hypothetical protein